jgi:hypothetical protein
MKRLIENKLLDWKNSQRRKPLIVRGARQVGKTYSVEKFGREAFNNLVTVDLEKNRDSMKFKIVHGPSWHSGISMKTVRNCMSQLPVLSLSLQ